MFQKPAFQSEINFFQGSSQKRAFLGAVGQAILDKLTGEANKKFLVVGQAINDALNSKDILIYFNDESLQKVMEENSWAGSILDHGCGQVSANCLGVVEANFGANKANYYLKRQIKIQSLLDKGGRVTTTVTINYQNDSPTNSWPGGTYKDYLRLLIPKGSELQSVDLGDLRKATVYGLLTAEVLAKVQRDQFFVFKSGEAALLSGQASQSAFLSLGSQIEVPIRSAKTVTMTYQSSYKVDFSQQNPEFNLTVLKQPGTLSDDLSLEIQYPTFLQPSDWPLEGALVFPGRLLYNVDLSADKVFRVTFKKQ